VVSVLLLVGFAGAGCGSDSDLGPHPAEPAVTVGSSGDVANRLVALVYAAALRGAGGQVRERLDLGDRAFDALQAGTVEVVPVRTGALLHRLTGSDGAAVTATPAPTPSGGFTAQFTALSAVLPEGLGLADPTPALDQPMLFVAGSATVPTPADCGALTGTVAVVGGTVGSDVAAVRSRYGCGFTAQLPVADAADAARAVADGRAQAAELGSLDPAARDLTMLTAADGAGTPPAEQLVAAFRRAAVSDRQVRSLNAVAGELTTESLAALVADVAGGRTPQQAVDGWLDAHPLS
jgi:osmoprotectant transport system substrate-binding protein